MAEIAIESSHIVEIEKFVRKASIDDRYRETPYYLAPEDQVGQEAFEVIRDAMKMVGIGRVVMARRDGFAQCAEASKQGRPHSAF